MKTLRNHYDSLAMDIFNVIRSEEPRKIKEEKRREETRRRGPGKALELWDKTKGKPPVSSEFGKRISG